MSKVFKNYREESRAEWGQNMEEGESLSREQLKLGCLLRIADSLEKIAQRYQSLIDERDNYKRWYLEEKKQRQRVEFRRRALKGVVTKLNRAG